MTQINSSPESSPSLDQKENKILRADFCGDYVPHHKHPLDYSNTENPLGCSPRVAEALTSAYETISRYPERHHTTLVEALSERHNISADSFIIGAGATGCIQNIVTTLVGSGGCLVLPELSFLIPALAASTIGGYGLCVPMKEDFRIDFNRLKQAVDSQTKLVFLCNPNNPTGLMEDPEEILAFARSVQVPVMVSEANIEYAGASLFSSYAKWPSNLIVLRSFSKAYGLAGLRVGYGVATSQTAKEVFRTQLPFPISRLSTVAALCALTDEDHVAKSIEHMRGERSFLTQELTSMGFTVLPSVSNSLLIGSTIPGLDGRKLVESLDKKGLTVVNGGDFSSSLANYIRVSPRKREANEALITAIREIVGA